MKIEGNNPPRTASAKRSHGTGAAPKGRFALMFGAGTVETPASGSAGAASAVDTIDALLTLQEVDDATVSRRKAKVRAEELLQQLDVLRGGLLTGSISRDQLVKLGQLSRSQRPLIDDPRLTEVLDEIDLRAQVELAKLEPSL